MPEIAYHPAQQIDAPEIAQIHLASWRDAYKSILDPAFLAGPIEIDRQEHWAIKLRSASTSLIVEVAFLDDQILIGFIAVNRGFCPR